MKDVAPYQELLTAELTRLTTELQSVGRRNPSNKEDWEPVPDETGQAADLLDAGEIIEGFGQNAAILKDLEARYHDVVGAFERIKGGTYGTCTVCEKEIEDERLLADPAAATCKEHLTT